MQIIILDICQVFLDNSIEMEDKKIICEIQDLTHLEWSKIRNSSGTAGSFLKAIDDLSNPKKYYKLSNYDSEKGITGHESVNEIIVDRLLTILGIPHLNYQLIHAKIIIDNKNSETYVCMSYDFKERGDSKIALDTYYQQERINDESLFEFCVRNGFEEYIYQMLVIDFLICNRDRHGANIEVLRNKYNKTIRLAPLFDHGLSLVFSCNDINSLDEFDVLKDINIQCCVGGNSSYENLKLIPENKHPKLNNLSVSDKDILFKDLSDILDERWIDKIWEMIYKRWEIYESIRNKR